MKYSDVFIRCQAVPVWALSLPLPAVVMIAVGLYMIFLATVLWCHHCLKVLQHHHFLFQTKLFCESIPEQSESIFMTVAIRQAQ